MGRARLNKKYLAIELSPFIRERPPYNSNSVPDQITTTLFVKRLPRKSLELSRLVMHTNPVL